MITLMINHELTIEFETLSESLKIFHDSTLMFRQYESCVLVIYMQLHTTQTLSKKSPQKPLKMCSKRTEVIYVLSIYYQ